MPENSHTDVLLAGAFAAFFVDLLVYPLDTLKTRFQSSDYQKIYYNSQNTLNRQLLFRGLYQGVGSVVLVTIPSSGAFFTTYEATKGLFSRANPTRNDSPLIPQAFIHSGASAVAELVSCFILTPAEVLKQNAQMIRRPTRTSSSSASTVFQSSVTVQALKTFQKPSQLWRGYTALAARNLPFTAMQFPMFEHLQDIIKQYRKRNGTLSDGLAETALIAGISAGCAGSIAAFITTPIDVVKTRIMLSAAGENFDEKDVKSRAKEQQLSKLASEKGAAPKSGFTVAREIMNEGGVKSLFRGGTLRVVWTALGSGLYLGTYQSARVWLEKRHGSDNDL